MKTEYPALVSSDNSHYDDVLTEVSQQMLLMEMWKVLIWSVNCLSSPSSAQTCLPHLTTHIWGENSCLWVGVCACYLKVLPFIDLKTHSFCVPVKPHVEVAARFIRSLHLSTIPISPPRFSSLVVWYHFTGSPDFPESPRGHVAHLLTSLPLELSKISPDTRLTLQFTLTSHL